MSQAADLIHPFQPLKLLRHADRIESMIRGDVVYPISVELDLSNTCNHGCPWCSFNGFRQDNWVQWPTDRAFALLTELAEVGVKSITFTGGGEPLTHKDAARLFRHCAALGMQFGVVTNGRLLLGAARAAIAELATFVRISLDAGTVQTHQMLHATAKPELTQILGNLRATRELAGERLTIGAAFCVFDVNVDEIETAAQLVKAHGGNYLEVRPVFPTEWRGGGFARALSDANVERAQAVLERARDLTEAPDFKVIGMIQRFDALRGAEKGFSGCHIGPLTTVINADGYIYHCCIQRGMPNFRAGSVLERPFKDVWWDAQHQAMVADIDVAKCPPCRYASYNRLIEQGFLKDGLHAAFV
jgi:radical SAM protein with 4Fe4S-binding SPASM domain